VPVMRQALASAPREALASLIFLGLSIVDLFCLSRRSQLRGMRGIDDALTERPCPRSRSISGKRLLRGTRSRAAGKSGKRCQGGEKAKARRALSRDLHFM
jgi:hypothetical protein